MECLGGQLGKVVRAFRFALAAPQDSAGTAGRVTKKAIDLNPTAFQKPGAGKRSRTPDLRITNALLYQLSYAGEARDANTG